MPQHTYENDALPGLLCRHCGWVGTPEMLDRTAPWGTACPQCVKPLSVDGTVPEYVAYRERLAETWAETPGEVDSLRRGGRGPATSRPHWRGKRDRLDG
jgi:hypothetical protein